MRAVLVLLGLAGVVRAQPVRLVVTSGSCDDLAEKLASVSTFATDARASVTVAEIEHTATVLLDDGNGHLSGPRVIHADDCDELARSVALVISIALPALADLPEPTPLPESNAIAVVLRAVKRMEPVPQTRDNEVVKRVEVDRSSSAKHALVASMGASSAVGMSFAVGVRWRWANTSIASEIAGTPPYDVVPSHVSVERASIAITPCHHIGDFGACGVLRVGVDRGVGTGLMGARSAVAPLVEIGPRLAWEHGVTDFLSLQLDAELDVAATTAQFDVDNMEVWRSSRFAGLAGAGVIMRFP